jgi:hypothetical protein
MTISNQPAESDFCKGDRVSLALGTYQGTTGVFLRLREDSNWADIAETGGAVRSHPVIWLAHSAAAAPGSVQTP